MSIAREREEERESICRRNTHTDARWVETTDSRLNAGRQLAADAAAADTGTGTSSRRSRMPRGAPSRRVRAAPLLLLHHPSIPPSFISSSPHRHHSLSSGPSRHFRSSSDPLHAPSSHSSSRCGAPMRFGWLAPLVPVSLVPDSRVLDSKVLPIFAGRSGLGSASGPPTPGSRGMGPKVVRSRDVSRPVAEPVPGSEGGASLHLRQGGEALAGSESNRVARCYQCCCCSVPS